jgi:hypothetical protein
MLIIDPEIGVLLRQDGEIFTAMKLGTVSPAPSFLKFLSRKWD